MPRKDGRRALSRAALTLAAASLILPASANATASVGSSLVGASVHKSDSGVATAFRAASTSAGYVDELSVYLDRSSTAKSVKLGLYSSDRKRSRVTGCDIASPAEGWNRCKVKRTTVAAKKAYWLGVLQPARSGGRLAVRAQRGSAGATLTSSSRALKALPTTLSGKSSTASTTVALFAAAAEPTASMSGVKTKPVDALRVADTQAPSVPQGMAWNGVTSNTVGLRWNAATDNVGVAGYRLYKNGVAVGTTTSLSYTYTGLTCATTYTFALEAYDAAGNASFRPAATGTISTAACPADTQAPAAPGSLAANGSTQTSAGLRWNASTDNVGVAGYRVYRNGSAATTTTSLSYSFAGLACGTSHTVAVEAYDAAGNVSSRPSRSISTSACPAPTPAPTPTAVPDTQRPATPQGMDWNGVDADRRWA